jgi:hypothetical protein
MHPAAFPPPACVLKPTGGERRSYRPARGRPPVRILFMSRRVPSLDGLLMTSMSEEKPCALRDLLDLADLARMSGQFAEDSDSAGAVFFSSLASIGPDPLWPRTTTDLHRSGCETASADRVRILVCSKLYSSGRAADG